jgi:hypothetical protein
MLTYYKYDKSLDIRRVQEVGVSYFYWRLFLNVQRGLFVGVFGKLKTTYLVLFGTGAERCFVHRRLMRLSLRVLGLQLGFGPLELE